MAEERIAGRYRLIEPLGRGAMSAVWLAEDEELGRQVAVKTLAPSADRARFEREARAAASLSHPNIAGLYDYGAAEGRPYMVLEYLPGGTLEERLRAGRPSDEETQTIAEGVAAGLAHAHERGLVHRDLKPANVLFDAEGRPKIADFGIARMGNAGTLTEAGTVLGTATYISPEQAAGQPAGPASDVYSFGAMLFRMLTGQLPFTSTNAMELVRMHRDDPAPSVRSVRPDAPPTLAAIADAALAKDPAERPADGAALLGALVGGGAAATAILAPTAAAEETQVLRPVAAAPRGRRRGPAPVAIAVVALLLLAGGAAAAWLATRSSGGNETPANAPPVPSLKLPKVTAGETSTLAATTAPATTAAVTTPTTTFAAATTATTTPTTTHAAPTTATTTPTTTHAAPTTTRPQPTTTAPAPVPTVTPPTTTYVPPVTTTDAGTTTTAATTTAATTTTGP